MTVVAVVTVVTDVIEVTDVTEVTIVIKVTVSSDIVKEAKEVHNCWIWTMWTVDSGRSNISCRCFRKVL